MTTVVVTGASADSTTANQTITREAIDRERPSSLMELLARQPGIFTDSALRSGGFSSIYVRGADPSHAVIVVDGVRQNDPLSSRGSAVDLNGLSLDDIERIEITKAGASVLHREALAGVIQISTRPPSSSGSARGVVELGQGGLAAIAGSISDDRSHFSVSRREDGIASGSGSSVVQSANVMLRDKLSGSTAVGGGFRFSSSNSQSFPDDSGGERYAIFRTKDQRSAQNLQLTLNSRHRLLNSDDLDMAVAVFSRQSIDSTGGVAPGVRDPSGLPPVRIAGKYSRTEGHAYFNTPSFLPGLEALAGIDAQQESVRFDSTISFGGRSIPASFHQSRGTLGFVGELRQETESMSLRAGVRLDVANGAPNLSAFSLRLAYRGLPGFQAVGLGASRSSKLPSFYALAHPIVGNRDLRPESADQIEAFIEPQQSANSSTKIVVFAARYRDLVDFDPGPPPRLVNRSEFATSGVEFSTQTRVLRNGTISAAGGLVDISHRTGPTTLRQRPARTARIRFEWAFQPEFDVALAARYVGRRLDSSIPTGDRWLAPYTVADIVARLTFASGVLFVRVENLLDRPFDETIGNPGGRRRASVGLILAY